MPWPEVRTVELRERFVKLVLREGHDKSALCREFGISRPTGYKWLSRYEESGRSGLVDRSKAAKTHPNAVLEEIEKEIVVFRGQHPKWGPLKIKTRLERQHPDRRYPAASTISPAPDGSVKF